MSEVKTPGILTHNLSEQNHITKSVLPENYGGVSGKVKNSCRSGSYSELDIDNRLVMNLRDLGHIIRFLYEGKGSQKRILIILNKSGGMTQRELTEKLGVQPGSASEVIGKLESAGLIERTPSRTDRRTADIKLTKAGLEKSNQAIIQRRMRHKEMFSCLTDEEKETLLMLTEKINNDWDNRYRESNREFTHFEEVKNDADIQTADS